MRLIHRLACTGRLRGVWRIKRILRSRLPERLSGTVPPLLVEVAIGVAVAVLFSILRLLVVPWTSDRVPFSFVYLAVVAATVLAGWRSGLVAIVIGQGLAWFLILDPAWTFTLPDAAQQTSLAVSTASELIIVMILALYQREVDRAWAKREGKMDLLHKALMEIDHRTINNYQTVLALVLTQAKSAKDTAVRDALQQVADRIRAIASASRQLAMASESLEKVRTADHLHELCVQIERGLSRPGISLECRFDDIVLPADQTICLSILVNELVTNSLKHAFPDDQEGVIRVALTGGADAIELTIEDNGVGTKATAKSRGSGLGTKLIATFVKQLRASHQISSGEAGTTHRIRFSPEPVS